MAVAQTFYIQDPQSNVPGIYIDSIDVFFKKMPSDRSKGITLTINEVENGFPTEKIVPFSKKRLLPVAPELNVSGPYPSGGVRTGGISWLDSNFIFDSPVFLTSNKEYAIVLTPDADDPNYDVWVAQLGSADVITSSTVYLNPGSGVFLSSSNGRTWTVQESLALKYRIIRNGFDLGGKIVYKNANTEYVRFSLPPSVSEMKIPIPEERVYVSNGIVTVSSNCGTTIGSTIVSVGLANASSLFAVNKMIYLRANNSAQTDIRIISTVPNSSHIVINSSPTFTDNNASIGYLYSNGGMYGKLHYIGPVDLALKESTANSTVNLRQMVLRSGYNANALLIGELSGASANLVTLTGLVYHEAVPQFSYTSPTFTSTSLKFKGTKFNSNALNSTTLDSAFTSVVSDTGTKLLDYPRYVRSRSDELYYSGGEKSLVVEAPITTTDAKLSPAYDDIKSDMLIIYNKISQANSSLLSDETRPQGGILNNKYISKPVVLLQEAEDILVYLTAYRPLNTEIYVFCKLLNSEDSEAFYSKDWTQLEEVPPIVYTSKANLNDMRELKFKLPDGTSATTTTTAFLNANNDGIVRYYNSDGAFFDGYSAFSIKIILTSTSGNIIPRVSDMRAIALQV